MSYINTPMTKLEAVNICLSSMGEPEVNSLENASVDAQLASGLIDETSRTVQGQGWNWNRERHTISPDEFGLINLPANIARVDTVGYDRDVDVVQRGLRLFDRTNNSYTFEKAVTVEMYVLLEFEELPLAAKTFITYKAARLFQQRVLGSETISKFTAEAEQRAYITLLQEEAEVGDYNMLYDSWQTYSILSRGFFSRGNY